MLEKAIRYSAENVVKTAEGSALKVQIGGIELLLPALTIGDETIFIFDPNQNDVRRAGEVSLTELVGEFSSLSKEKGETIFRFLTPESDKSSVMTKHVAQALSDTTGREFRVDTQMFLKAKTREELAEKLGKNAHIIDYSPITRKSSFIGISQSNAQLLQSEFEQGMQFLQLDDVISTGATVKAIQALMTEIIGDAASKLPVFAVAREIPVDASPESDPDNWFYSMVIPVLRAIIPV